MMLKISRRSITSRESLFESEEEEYGLNEYQLLWFAVLQQAIKDANFLDNTNITKRNQAKDAIVWLLTSEDDLDLVCLNAGVDSDWFRNGAHKWLKERFNAELLGTVFAPHRRKRGAKVR